MIMQIMYVMKRDYIPLTKVKLKSWSIHSTLIFIRYLCYLQFAAYKKTQRIRVIHTIVEQAYCWNRKMVFTKAKISKQSHQKESAIETIRFSSSQ